MAEPQKARINRDVSHIEKKVISGMEFISISDELWRSYTVIVPIPDGTLTEREYRIEKPLWLFVRPSGSHMVFDEMGVMHYVPVALAIRWKNKEDAPEANW